MSLLEDARRLQARPAASCALGKLLVDDDGELAELLAATDIPNTIAAQVIQDRGLDITYQTVQRHRTGRCKCRL